MSIDAFVFMRTEPLLDMAAHDVVTIELMQILAPRRVVPDDWRRIGRAPDPSLGWLVDVNCNNRCHEELASFATALAERCGGGLWWCDLTSKVVDVPSRPASGGGSLRRVLAEVQARGGFDHGGFDLGPPDLSAWRASQRPRPANLDARYNLDPAWDIAVAKVGTADAWLGISTATAFVATSFLALLDGDGPDGIGKAAIGTMRRALEHTRGHTESAPIGAAYAAESPAAWVTRVQAHAAATTFKKKLFRKPPPGWGALALARMERDTIQLACAGDARVYRVSARGVELLAGPDGAASAPPANAIGPRFVRVDERTVRLATDDTIVMCSAHIWRALGDGLAAAIDLAHRDPNGVAAARTLLEHAGRATRAVAIVAHYRGYETV